MNIATHWSAYDKPEDWSDNPAPTPQAAVEQLVEDFDSADASDLMHDLRHYPQKVTVRGYIETNAPLPEVEQFDGYEPGQTYFAPTGEKLTVRVSLAFEVLP